MQNAVQFIDPTAIIFAKLLLAMFLGGVIGTERAVLARQAAGTRTFGLVALGACLFIVIANYVDTAYIGLLTFDPLRVAAAIIMGVGFLAGGLIIFKGDAVHGTTTAAGLWIVTGLGMAVGFGLYAVAVFTTVITLIMFTGMWYVENRFKHWF
ncbi:MAG: MgtC/SapB family protein, partial [Patescibacteria group bacterium]